MARSLKCAVLVCAALLLFASAPRAMGAAEEGDARARRRREDRQRWAARARQSRDMALVQGLTGTGSEKARAEMKRYREALAALMKKVQQLRAQVKKEIDAGATPKEAAEAHLDEAKAIAKEMLAEEVTHLKNMAEILKAEGPALVDKLAKQLLMPPPQRRRRVRPVRPEGDRPAQRPKPKPEEAGPENPFEE